jgi:hypothetical protein
MPNPTTRLSAIDSAKTRESENPISPTPNSEEPDQEVAPELRAVLLRGHRQGREQRAHARRRHEDAVAARARVQDVVGVDRHEHGVLEAERAGRAEQDQQVAQPRRVPRVGHAFLDVRQRRAAGGLGRDRGQVHAPQPEQDRDVGGGVDPEARGLAERRQHQARERRAEQARGVEDRRMQRDRVRQDAGLDRLGDERLPRRQVECVDDAHHHHQAQHEREPADGPRSPSAAVRTPAPC